jgi:hypothetical protein
MYEFETSWAAQNARIKQEGDGGGMEPQRQASRAGVAWPYARARAGELDRTILAPAPRISGAPSACGLILQRRNISWLQPELIRLEQTAHNLAAAGLGESVHKVDFTWLGNGAKVVAHMILQRLHHL